MESKHIKGTWGVYHYLHESSIYGNEEQKGIAKLKFSDFPYDEETVIANADHIVKCVNSHDELVKALEDILKYDFNNDIIASLKDHDNEVQGEQFELILNKAKEVYKRLTNTKPIN